MNPLRWFRRRPASDSRPGEWHVTLVARDGTPIEHSVVPLDQGCEREYTWPLLIDPRENDRRLTGWRFTPIVTPKVPKA